jgi:hypothetical protein
LQFSQNIGAFLVVIVLLSRGSQVRVLPGASTFLGKSATPPRPLVATHYKKLAVQLQKLQWTGANRQTSELDWSSQCSSL